MNYDELRRMANEGINFFSDSAEGSGFCVLIKGGGVEMVNGVEVVTPHQTFTIQGLIRDVNARDVNGDTIRAEDKRGIFSAYVPIEKGNWIVVDGVKYEVVNPRAIRPQLSVVAYRPILRQVAAYG